VLSPRSLREAYSAPPDPLAGFKVPTSKGRKGKKDGRKGQRMGRREGRGPASKVAEGRGGRGEFASPNIKIKLRPLSSRRTRGDNLLSCATVEGESASGC